MSYLGNSSNSRSCALSKLSLLDLEGIQGGTPPHSEENRLGYSIHQAPHGAVTGTITYDRNFGNGYHGGADLTRQGGQTFGGVHFGGRIGAHGTWDTEVNRMGNETNITVRGGFKF